MSAIDRRALRALLLLGFSLTLPAGLAAQVPPEEAELAPRSDTETASPSAAERPFDVEQEAQDRPPAEAPMPTAPAESESESVEPAAQAELDEQAAAAVAAQESPAEALPEEDSVDPDPSLRTPADDPAGNLIEPEPAPSSPTLLPDPAVIPDGLTADELPASPATPFGLLDKARLDAWLDGLVEASMLADHLPGVIVSVVEADQLVTSRGWGFADLEQRELANPSQSLFRVGSISKVVSATALMQLVERGAVDLKQSVGRYLDPLPYPDGEAVTLTHLLTHQPGFEDGYMGHFFAIDAATDHELLPYLNRFPPARVRVAGELSSYSNYGYAVLGAVIASVSGESFETHMDKLLGSFGMHNSTFRERAGIERDDAMSAELAGKLAEGYRWAGWQQQRNEKFWMHRGMAPAGSMSSTADDMARFMRLHLNHGQIDGRVLLQRETLDTMHGVLTRHHEAVGGNAHGFWARELSGLRTIEHAGAVLNFHSNLVLIPEAGVGIFVSTNGAAGRQFVQDLPRLLVEQFLASRTPPPFTAAADLAERAQRYVGSYRTTRRNYSKFEAAGGLFGGDTEVSFNADKGVLLLSGQSGTQAFRERDPGVFVAERDGTTLAFSSIADGPAQRAWPSYGHVVLERVPWYGRTDLYWGVAGSLLLLSLLRVLGLRLRRPVYGGWVEHMAAGISWLAAAGWLAFAVGLYLVFEQISPPDSDAIARYPDVQVIWTLGIGLAAAALSLLALLFLPALLSRGQWPAWRRLHYLLFVLAALAALPLLWYWRLLGFHFHGVSSVFLPPLM
jgi:CubicO group peptidase (beta-lactamase class C family)